MLDNYIGKFIPSSQNCLGYEANRFYMYPNNNNRFSCFYFFDLSDKVFGDNVDTNLILGSHKEVKLNINWQIVERSKNYVKPILKGNVK